MGQFEIYPPNCGATGGPLPTPKDAGWIPACAGMTITTAALEPPRHARESGHPGTPDLMEVWPVKVWLPSIALGRDSQHDRASPRGGVRRI